VASERDDPIVQFASQRDWEQWLEANHETSGGVWVKLARSRSGIESVSRAGALEGALCFGWIDGQGKSLDERFWLQRFTPRRSKSSWSRINREKAIELIAKGRMRPSGLAQVELAKRDGRWDEAYEPPSTAAVPDDLQRELDRRPRARAAFAGLDSRNRYAILYRLQDAKRPETRARRLEQFVAMLEEGRRLYP
jgi:uncharacterized protein YdeI (YjbR/CyaY-like superfamily)